MLGALAALAGIAQSGLAIAPNPAISEMCLWKIAQLAVMPCRSSIISADIVLPNCSRDRPCRSSIRKGFPG